MGLRQLHAPYLGIARDPNIDARAYSTPGRGTVSAMAKSARLGMLCHCHRTKNSHLEQSFRATYEARYVVSKSRKGRRAQAEIDRWKVAGNPLKKLNSAGFSLWSDGGTLFCWPEPKGPQLAYLADNADHIMALLEQKERGGQRVCAPELFRKPSDQPRAQAARPQPAGAPRKAPSPKPKLGAPHPLYKRNDGFYESKEWRQVRYAALKACGARCLCCGSSAADGARLHVDHIKPRYTHTHLSLELSNLQVLCEDCNLGKGAWDDTDWRHFRSI
jgi:5-methylcytosine-specific restriction endonuclease McrA